MSGINIDRRFRPKDLIPDAVFIPAGTELSADNKQRFEGVRYGANEPPEELCRACGWDSFHELTSTYLPRLRIFRARLNSGLWVMGNDYAIWDRAGGKRMNNDYITHQFLKEKCPKNIPLLKEMHQFGKLSDPYHFVVMSQAKGAPLINIWPTASPEEKRGYADQLISAIRELRQYTAPYPQRVDGGPLSDNIIAQCAVPKSCIEIGKTTEDWFNNMDAEMRRGLGRQHNTTDDAVIEEKLKDLKKNFPDGAPYVLTHGDLHCGNIIVNKGKIQAIIDWEVAGYYPAWMERWAQSSRCQSDGCIELYEMVWGELEPKQDAKEFQEKVCGPIGETEKVWDYCPITHTEAGDVWRRPKWCECKPLGGLLRRHILDAELKHEIDYSETARATYNPESYSEEEIAEEFRLLSQ